MLLHRPWFFSRDDFHVLVGDFELVMSRGHRLEWLALHVCAWKAGPTPSLKDDQYILGYFGRVSLSRPQCSIPLRAEVLPPGQNEDVWKSTSVQEGGGPGVGRASGETWPGTRGWQQDRPPASGVVCDPCLACKVSWACRLTLAPCLASRRLDGASAWPIANP